MWLRNIAFLLGILLIAVLLTTYAPGPWNIIVPIAIGIVLLFFILIGRMEHREATEEIERIESRLRELRIEGSSEYQIKQLERKLKRVKSFRKRAKLL